MKAGRKWRRTAVTLNGQPVPLRDDWSLYDAASELEIARISRTPDGDWRYIVRTIRENELKDESMGWMKTGPEAKEYCESQTSWRSYNIGRKRTKAEILAHAGVRPMPKVGRNDRRSFGLDIGLARAIAPAAITSILRNTRFRWMAVMAGLEINPPLTTMASYDRDSPVGTPVSHKGSLGRVQPSGPFYLASQIKSITFSRDDNGC